MTRTQYITIAELNEILDVSSYTDDDLVKVYEASELLKYHMNDQLNDYDTSNAPIELKLATAYQTQYMEGFDDNTYVEDSFSIGKYSSSGNKKGESSKISPKASRYLFDGGLTRRVL